MSDRKPASDSGLSVQTLLISAASAVIATLVVSQFWQAGTLFFTALVPVTVAVVSEILKRPADKITAVAPLVAPRVVPGLRPDRNEVREPVESPAPPAPRFDDFEDGPGPPGDGSEVDPFGLYDDRNSPLSGRVVRIGLVTGLLAFVLAAAFVTASELALFGGSIGGGDRRTTLVGGSSKKSETRDAKETATPDADATPGATATATPEASETPDPEATPTPTPTPSASATPSPSPGASATATPPPTGGTTSP